MTSKQLLNLSQNKFSCSVQGNFFSEIKATEVSSPRKILRENFKTQDNIHLSCDCLFTYDCYLPKIVYLLTIVAFFCSSSSSSSSKGSDCNRDASSVSFLRQNLKFSLLGIKKSRYEMNCGNISQMMPS